MGHPASDYDKAIPAYEHALSIDTDGAAARYGLGISWTLKGEDDRAIRYLNRAIEIIRRWLPPARGRGDAL